MLAILLDSGSATGRAMNIVREACRSGVGIRGVFARNRELAQNTKEVGPAGAAEPSEADITPTLRLQVALNTADIRVLDHLVLSEQDVVSLSERPLMG